MFSGYVFLTNLYHKIKATGLDFVLKLYFIVTTQSTLLMAKLHSVEILPYLSLKCQTLFFFSSLMARCFYLVLSNRSPIEINSALSPALFHPVVSLILLWQEQTGYFGCNRTLQRLPRLTANRQASANSKKKRIKQQRQPRR